MSTQVSVNLAFTANTEQAKQQLQALQTQLNQITMNTKIGSGITEDLQGAVKAATELQIHLKNATNVNTGNLDFAKLNQSIKQSGMTLEQYGMQLRSIGPQGQQAFMSLANSIASAEIPLKRSNKLLQSFSTTLANTAKWQLSSSMLHGFMSATQAAYGYAQDLNESLNNIRIVTGQNIDQMANFAKEANKAAQALSTTTTEYTNASLIYYQQGLNDQQVKERTDITIKMANVARQSAEVVSDQMTAVWNNFYDGSKSLEHYADVMTALGAATASSTDEIAGGLEKFAAIGNTIGLSFEYAASALATITSNTRQSEEVVGTALKTIFARIQGLKLGETLEDGTELNKYSEALNKVGINIFDSAGEMKKMDTILDEMAEKWESLSNAQQVALAQTVAGVRQYTQLIALMDNWNNGDSDSMIANLTTSASSSGALQQQADIYAESWEGARDRVKAAAESIYSSLINDEAFIDMLNGVEKVLGFIKDLIDSLGGLKGVLMAIGTIVTKVFSQQLSQGLSTMAYNIKMATKSGREKVNNERIDFIDKAKNSIAQPADYDDPVVTAQKESMESQLTLQKEMLTNAEKMSQYEFERNKMLIDRSRLMREQAVAATKEKQQADDRVDKSKYGLQSRIYTNNKNDPAAQSANIKELNKHIQAMKSSSSAIADINSSFNKFAQSPEKGKKSVTELKKAIASLRTEDKDIQELVNRFSQLDLNADNAEEEVKSLVAQIRALTNQSAKNIKDLIPTTDKEDYKKMSAEVDELVDSIDTQTESEKKREAAVKNGANAHKLAEESIHGAMGAQKSWSDIIVEGANVAFSAAMAFQMLGNMIDTIKDPDVSGWEKFQSILMTLGMTIPMLISVWGTLKSLISAETAAKLLNVAATIAQVVAEKSLKNAKDDSADAIDNSKNATNKDTKRKLGQTLKDKGQNLKDQWTKRAIDNKYGGNAEKWANGAWHTGKGSSNGGKLISGKEAQALSKGATKALGTAALSVAAIAAGIAVLVGGIKWGIAQANKAEKAIEKAKEKVAELQSNLDTVKNVYSEFQSKTSAFENASKGIEGLTKGTKEYKQAVFEANQAAMALIESNKNLKYSVKDGIITFDEGELERALEEQQDSVTKAQAAKMLGDQAVMAAEQNKSVRDYARDLDSKSDNGQNAKNILGAVGTGLTSGALVGGGIGGLVGGTATVGIFTLPAAAIGAIIGGVVGAVGGLVTGIVGTKTTGAAVAAETEAIEKLAAAYKLDSSILAKDKEGLKEYLSKSVEEGGLGIDDDQLVSALAENADETRALISEMARNTEAINAQNDQIAAQAIGDAEYLQNSEYKDAIIDKTGDVYGNLVQEILNSEGMEAFGKQFINKNSGASEHAKEAFDTYLESAGLSNQGYTLKDVEGTDEERIFVYLDSEGNEKKVSLETMKYTIATAQATERLEGVGLALLQDFNTWARDDKDPASQAILSFFSTGAFGEATFAQFTDLQKDIEAAGGTEAYLKSIFGEDLEQVAQKYGYDNAAALIAAFNAGISQGITDWDGLSGYGDVRNDTNLSDMTSMDTMVDRLNTRIEGAGDAFSSGLDDLLSGLSEKDKEAAMSKIMAIDWTQFDAGYQVLDILKEFGIELSDEALPAFESWVNTINQASGALFDFTASAKSIEEVRAMAADIEFGDTIAKEDFDKLASFLGESIYDYFSIRGTGEATLTGDPLDFKQEIERNAGKAYWKDLGSLQTNVDTLKEEVRRTTYADTNFGDGKTAGSGYSYLQAEAGRMVDGEVIGSNDQVHWLDKAVATVGNGLAYGLSGGKYKYGSFTAQDVANWADWNNNATEIKGPDKFEKTADDIQLYQDQLKFLTEGLGYTTEKLEELDIQIDATKYTYQDAQNIAKLIKDETKNGAKTDKDLEALEKQMWYAESEWLRTLEPDEQQEQIKKGNVSNEAYGMIAKERINTEAWEGLEVEEVEEYAKYLEDVFGIAEEQSEEAARSIVKMNKGITTLNENWEEWGSILKKSSKYSEEYSDAMAGVRNALSDVLDVSEDFIDIDFVQSAENLALIERAAQGDAAAIDALGQALAKDIALDAAKDKLDLGKAITIDGIEYKGQEALNKISTLMSEISTLLSGQNLELGQSISNTALIDKMNSIVEAAGMTVEESNAYFRSLGFTPEFEMIDAVQAESVPLTKTYHQRQVTEWGGFLNSEPIAWIDTEYQTTEQTPGGELHTALPSMATKTLDGKGVQVPSPKVKKLTYTGGGSFNNFSSSNPGGKKPSGSGSEKKTVDRPKRNDMVDRYREIDDALNDLQETMTDADRLADNLWGPKRITQLESNIGLIEEEVELLKERNRQSEAYLARDRQDLDKAAKTLGFTIKYDDDGDVLNATEIQEALFKRKDNAVISANKGGVTDEEQKSLDDLDENIDTFESALDQYTSTQQEISDNNQKIKDDLQRILDMYATIFSEKWELEVELNEDELQRLDYYLSKTENDFYQRAEGLAILGQQTGVYTQQLETQQAAWDELNQLKAEGKISDEFYMEQLNATKNAVYDNLQALQDLDKQMMEYYGETLQMASEEIDKITDQMEHHNSVLEHYLSILELMGESANYKTIGVVLEGQAEVKKDRMIAAQQEWQTFQAETDAKYLAWKNATDEASAEMLKKQYEDALAISTEKQEEYLTLAEEYAESLKAILENSLKEYAQDLENALTGGTSFDQMNTKLERAAALQEEYLTTTNKIYETNKLMNTAQQEIDKTTNTIAKQRLKQFIDETNQLQKKNKLSQYELDIQQAKYDLLLAEIALEEAQNAKSSVRLQRDSEGNFGYVYTADEDKIAEAQQQLADAQNSLYNIALEGSNDYFTKYQETLNEMYDTFTELHQQYLDGEFESEQEYQNAVAEAKQYYYELLEQYSDLYTIAISTDARALEDAWSSEFNSMIYNTKNWQTQVDVYIQKSQQSFFKYAKQIDILAGELGVSGSYNEVANSVGNIVDQNETLLATLLSPGGVFDTMEMEIALVNDVCAAYAVERATVLELIKTYEALALSIMNVKRVEAGKEPLGSLDLPTNNAEQETAVPGSAKAGDGVPKVGDRVKYNSGKYYHSSDGLSPTGTKYQGSEVYITDINTADWAKYPYHISTGNKLYSGDLGWLKLDQISGYDTGGYTGRWGSYGKLAMLHEKEIVLNKQDTANFLQSMELLDNIVKTIDLYSANQQISGLLNSPSFGKLDSDTLEQMVTIDAHFPNVSSRVEIEEAFSTLINRASQYINRN